jgi:hypothetical protein
MSRNSRSVVDAVKLLALNAQLLDIDLERIQREHNLDLGHRARNADEPKEDYYPQFDEDLRREAAEMAQHYELFYCLERSIRRLIAATLADAAGALWWDSGRVPNAIHQEVAKRMQREVDSAITVRSSESIEFTTFGELGDIINANWDLFGGIFNSQRAVAKVMANLNTLRGPIAHCSRLAEDEILRLELSLRDWFRLME